MIKRPIWKDTIHYFDSEDVQYRIAIDSGATILYEGRAKAKPNGVGTSVNINNICRNYLLTDLPQYKWTYPDFMTINGEAFKKFDVMEYVPYTGTWEITQTYGFLNCWDYGWDKDMLQMHILSCPVNGHCATGQYCAQTFYDGASTDIVETHFSQIPADCEFWGYTTGYCGDYALIYKNRMGGFDSFLFEGLCKQTDEYVINQLTKNYDNMRNEFGKKTYMNQITKRWELNSGFLTTEQAEIFAKHLASSTECFLQDLNHNEIYPVVIADKSVEYQRYENRPKEPINYTITVEQSQKETLYE